MREFSSKDYARRFASSLAASTAGPGSNGYRRRRMWLRSGAFTFTVKKTGKIKIACMGAGGGGAYESVTRGGSGGGLSISEYDVTEGDVINITVGVGGLPATDGGTPGNNGGASSVTGPGISMSANGGQGGQTGGGATGGSASGGNISNTNGGSTDPASRAGGASSATPYGNGYGSLFPYQEGGGAGWGGAAANHGGASSHSPSAPHLTQHGANGLKTRGGIAISNTLHGEGVEWWDLEDIDGGGGAEFGNGGPGAGGGAHGNGGFGGGGGGGYSTLPGGHGGNGAGGGTSGAGGDGAVIIYWEEV